MGNVIFHRIRIFKLLRKEVPFFRIRFQIERVSQEVVRCRVFIHPADKIRNCIQEMLVLDYRSIENHPIAEHGLGTP